MNIKDIAKICGVSTATVSKVLNNKDASIREETRQKVLSVVKEYNFVPYSKTIKQMSVKNNMLAVLLDNSIYFEKELLYYIEKAALKRGYTTVVFCITGNDIENVRYIQILEDRGISGFISLGTDGTQDVSELPHVFVTFEDNFNLNENRTFVCFSRTKASYCATSYLLDRAHRNISLITEDAAVEEGFYKAFNDAAIAPPKRWIFSGQEEEIEQALIECQRSYLTAIICQKAEIAKKVYDKADALGIKIPEQLSVISIEDAGYSEHLIPSLTTIKIPFMELAEAVIDSMLKMIEEKKAGYDCLYTAGISVEERDSVVFLENKDNCEEIIVFGSMNMDYNLLVEKTPTPGTTVMVRNTLLLPGGEGANQAVGIGKLGGKVYMIGCMGNDSDGAEILKSLEENGVNTDGVSLLGNKYTGRAYITVSADGDSTILLSAGANDDLDCDYIDKNIKLLERAKYCLISTGIPEKSICYLFEICKKMGICVLFQPAEADKVKEKYFQYIDFFIPNESQAEKFVPGRMAVEERAQILYAKGLKNVIILLNQGGCYLKTKDYSQFIRMESLQKVDVTGVTDAFISALTVSLSKGYNLIKAIKMASYAAAVSTTKVGVQQAMIDKNVFDVYEKVYGEEY